MCIGLAASGSMELNPGAPHIVSVMGAPSPRTAHLCAHRLQQAVVAVHMPARPAGHWPPLAAAHGLCSAGQHEQEIRLVRSEARWQKRPTL